MDHANKYLLNTCFSISRINFEKGKSREAATFQHKTSVVYECINSLRTESYKIKPPSRSLRIWEVSTCDFFSKLYNQSCRRFRSSFRETRRYQNAIFLQLVAYVICRDLSSSPKSPALLC